MSELDLLELVPDVVVLDKPVVEDPEPVRVKPDVVPDAPEVPGFVVLAPVKPIPDELEPEEFEMEDDAEKRTEVKDSVPELVDEVSESVLMKEDDADESVELREELELVAELVGLANEVLLECGPDLVRLVL